MKAFLRSIHRRPAKVLLVLLLISSFLLSACQTNSTEKYRLCSFVYPKILDTDIFIDVYLTYDQDREYHRQWIQESLERYHQLFDAYNSYDGINNIYTINQNAGKAPVAVEKEVFDLIQFCLEQREYTMNRTNIAFGTVTTIWKQYMDAVSTEREANRDPQAIALPSADELTAAGQHINMDCIQLDETAQTVYLTDPEMRLDVGAVAKGYIAELLADEMQEAGIQAAILNLGGNVKILGERKSNDGRTYFLTGIEDPSNLGAENGIGLKIRLDDQACLVTSGNYIRFVEVDGVRYHHLIDPDTLQPAQGMKSVTILATDSGLADYLSTALFTVDMETGEEIASHYEGVEVFWITKDGETRCTTGFLDYITNLAE